MAKVFKRKDNKDSKGKKPFGTKRDKDNYPDKKPFFKKDEFSDSSEKKSRNDDKEYKEKRSDSPKKSYSDKTNKPAFERYRDDSRPSDFGTPKRRSSSEGGNFRRKSSTDKPFFKRKDGDNEDKRSFRDKDDKSPGAFRKPFERSERKSFSDKPKGFIKSKPSVNPNDLDESDFEYGKPKPSYDSSKGKDFKRKPFARKTYSTKKPVVSKPQREEDDGMIRLNKYIANAGICSRREADDLITSGVVQVNGKTITEMGFRVKPTDIIKYGGQTLKKERMVYLVLNKPKDYITTFDDPQKRKTVLELVQNACKERIYPVGRLDRATTGLLMFTNDGELTKKLTHPKYGVRKIYHVELDKPLKRQDLEQIAEGLELEDGPIKVDEVTYVGDGADKASVGVEIHSGKNRIVRRIFEHMGYNVRKLDRVMFGSLTKKDLPRGRWRFLTDAEVGMLKMISAE